MSAPSTQSQHPYGSLYSDNISSAVNETSLTDGGLKDHLSCGNEFALKVRKPYTITKQRERWKEEEHEKFLEALKLYGRDWRQIEEHVGTKTAIQIRSHAQKFFSKVTRSSHGCSTTLIERIEIPPPRPKRKPLHPYPRKEAHHLHKVTSILELTRPLSPQLSVSDKESQCPTSMMVADSGSDTLVTANSNIFYDSESPDSSVPFSSSGLTSTGLNSSFLENECPSLTLEKTDSTPQDKVSENLDMFLKDDTHEKDVATQSLKLFGRTVLIPDAHKPIPTVDQARIFEQTSPWNSLVKDSTNGNIECTWSHGAFYFIQLNNEKSNQVAVPVSCWRSYGGRRPLSFMHHSNEDDAKKEPGSIGKPSFGSNTRSKNSDKDSDSVSKHESIGKPLFSRLRNGNEKNAKGFVPYKRCIVERNSEASRIAGAEVEEKRIRLCL